MLGNFPIEMPNSLGNFAWDAKNFSREFCMGMPKTSLGNFAWDAKFPVQWGIPKSTEGVLKSLGNLTRGCQILGGYSPVAINFAWLWWSLMASEALPYGLK